MSGAEITTWWGSDPNNIIIRMPNWLGDLVMATPVLEDLRRRFPNAKITAMCVEHLANLLEHNPHIDRIFSFSRPSGWLHHAHHIQVIEPLRCENYDLGILLTNSLSSAWWFWRGHIERRLGYVGHWRRGLLTKALAYPQNIATQHLVITYKQLLKPLGMTISDTMPALYFSDEESSEVETLLRNHGVGEGDTIIGINPGAAFGSAKCWLPDRFKDLTQRLALDSTQKIVYFGDHAGTELVNDICHNMPDNVINLAGKTSIRELCALIRRCNILITNDSGPMHVAAAVGTAPLALFGSTSDVKTGPYKLGRVIHKRVECSPCYKRVCPIDFRCMKRIEVDEVYETTMEMLGK